MQISDNNGQQPKVLSETYRNTGDAPWEWEGAARHGNPMGTAGIVLALLALALAWIPILGWVLWLAGLTCSLIGLMRNPRWGAVCGLIVSVSVMLLAIFISAIGSRAVSSLFNFV